MIFLTGFPGFLGKEIVPRLLERDQRVKVVCLVQERFLGQAKDVVGKLAERYPDIGLEKRISLVVGDITDKQLGLGDEYGKLAKKVTEVYHFAAVYDLDVGRDFAYKVNVDGTENVITFCGNCPKLKRHHYVSTCYVSGKHPGLFREDDLEMGQGFNNFYEETKYLAEILVRKSMEDGMPTTIYRPSIVTGDSTTGATQKYDGPYYMLRWLMRNPYVGVFPTLGDGKQNTMNIVPRDYIIDAITALSGMKESIGKTYNLADPNPLTISEIADAFGDALGIIVLKVPLPLDAEQAVWTMRTFPVITDFMGVPTKAIAYFAHPTHYDTTNSTRDLHPAGIRCPNYGDYMDNIVRFVKANPDVSTKAMV